MRESLSIPPVRRIRLRDVDPDGEAHRLDKDTAAERVARHVQRMADLQRILYATRKHALLIVLQGMDGAGKDGTVRHVMTGLNPLGCRVVGFTVPTAEEASHDFLWRVHRETPPLGWIGLFNRSHYEDVLAARVRRLVPTGVWRGRYDHINAFESLLADSGVVILKFFLHISRKEQKERLTRRLHDPSRAWKVDPVDWENRRLWKEYMAAYEDAFARCGTSRAPWYIVPANHKWYRDLLVSERIVAALEALKLKYPRRPAAARGRPAGR